MKIIKSSDEITSFLSSIRNGISVGFVPTMGALHQGHAALIEQSVRENDYTICSIFVNPLQFNRKEDLDSYPDRMREDVKMLEGLACDLLFCPTAEDIYSDDLRLNYDFGSIGQGMEAEYRPGHFPGVAEVIHRFFSILHPDKAYFGEKDYQQLAVIRWLVEKYDHSTEVIACETIRDQSGLAMSSRNYNLSTDEYRQAAEIYQTLQFARSEKANASPKEIEKICFSKLKKNFKPEYFTIADQYSMIELEKWEDSDHPRAFVAAYCGEVRLIDNISLAD